MQKVEVPMLINCAAYHDGRKMGDIPVSDISEYVAKPDCFVWVALKDPNPEELAQMAHEFGLHELAVEDASHGHQRPKIEEYGASLFAVLHTVEQTSDKELEVGEVAVFAGANYVLTVRAGSKQGFQDVRARCERDAHLLRHGSAFVLYALIDSVVDRYFPVVEALIDESEIVEDRIFENKGTAASRDVVEDLYSLKRRFVRLHHHVAPLLEAVGKLQGGRVPTLCAGMEAYFRDVYDHLVRIDKLIEGRREMISTAIQVNLGMISLAESETTKRLGAFGALFASPTMIAGIYGMNFQSIPELHWQYGYPACLAVMLAIDAVLWWRFRKAGWL
ncbi:Magnesium and cobalt transport protein corA (plasmid) [Mycetohabitans rhizoxinica HKI 454]|uniref:Magnesium transport protein CorA n=2 Tax=Burkholderiaceae TaxID=119060 RepID=E5ATW9_MYCRK|nr:Magnesium and cobalt transport protein corA [Mycetohabitans rhizoxinica HKI 454]